MRGRNAIRRRLGTRRELALGFGPRICWPEISGNKKRNHESARLCHFELVNPNHELSNRSHER